MRTKSDSRVLLDNSAFAGVMRLYAPDLEMHSTFLKNYPSHRSIDERSLADFLTSLVVYGRILLDSRSAWNERELKQEGYESGQVDGSSASWAEQLVRLLPKDVASVITADWFGGPSSIDENESCAKAFDILTSPLKYDIVLGPNDKIPNVYFAADYVYRPEFENLNAKNGNLLSDGELAQAMFLHRGLFLQSHAHSFGCTYLPYFYRGRMLTKLPPMVWARAPNDGFVSARLPLLQGLRPSERDYMRSLNEFYYSLLQAATWTTYDNDIPFVGAAILARAHGDPREAMNIAMEFRERGTLQRIFEELKTAADAQDRPRFESLLKGFRSELNAAASHFGVEIDNPQIQALYKLATHWTPKGVQASLDAAVTLLPESIRHWGYQIASTMISSSPLQVLFADHVSAVRRS